MSLHFERAYLLVDIDIDATWHVGRWRTAGESATFSPLLTDAHGRPWIPGSSIAGGLRRHLDGQPGLPALDLLMGPTEGELTASALWVLGSVIGDGAQHAPTTVTAIDRWHQSARPGSLRSIDIVQPGTTLQVHLRLDALRGGGDLPIVAGDLARALASWTPVLGSGRTVGRGRAHVTRVRWTHLLGNAGLGRLLAVRHAADGPADLLPALLDNQSAEVPGLRAGCTARLRAVSAAVARVDTEDAVLVAVLTEQGDGRLGVTSADPTVRTGPGKNVSVPGSTWKGLLRSRFEYILRSRGEQSCDPGTPCPQAECLACQTFGSTHARGRIGADDTLPRGGRGDVQSHVALDRISGGARDHHLWIEPVRRGGEHTLILRSLAPLAPEVREILLLVLRDLDEGLIGLGPRTATGLGTVQVTSVWEHAPHGRSGDHPPCAWTPLDMMGSRT